MKVESEKECVYEREKAGVYVVCQRRHMPFTHMLTSEYFTGIPTYALCGIPTCVMVVRVFDTLAYGVEHSARDTHICHVLACDVEYSTNVSTICQRLSTPHGV